MIARVFLGSACVAAALAAPAGAVVATAPVSLVRADGETREVDGAAIKFDLPSSFARQAAGKYVRTKGDCRVRIDAEGVSVLERPVLDDATMPYGGGRFVVARAGSLKIRGGEITKLRWYLGSSAKEDHLAYSWRRGGRGFIRVHIRLGQVGTPDPACNAEVAKDRSTIVRAVRAFTYRNR